MTKVKTAKAEMKKEELVSMVKESLPQDPDFIDAIIAAAMPARSNPSPTLDLVEAIYSSNPELRSINIVGNCSGCGHPIADGDTACISCGETLED